MPTEKLVEKVSYQIPALLLLLLAMAGCVNNGTVLTTNVTPSALATRIRSESRTPPPSKPAVTTQAPVTALPTIMPLLTVAPEKQMTTASCLSTFPNGKVPSGEYPAPIYHGNDSLWTIIPAGGKMLVEPTSQFLHADGSIEMKWPWWRGVRGELKVTGQRLDASAPPAIGYYDVKGYGLEGFQAGAIVFPGGGCWEITGQVDGASLAFTILVIKIPFEPFEPNWLPEGMLVKDKKVAELPTTIQEIYGVPIWDQDMVSWDEGELVIETSHGVPENSPSYPSYASQLSTVVMGEPGICVQGAWDKQGQWQAEANAAILEWSSDEFSYRISHTGLGLTCGDLLRIAGSSS